MKNYKDLEFLTKLTDPQVRIIDELINNSISLTGLSKLIDFIINNRTLHFKWNEDLNYFDISLNNSVLLCSQFFKLNQFELEEITELLKEYFYITSVDNVWTISTEDTYL